MDEIDGGFDVIIDGHGFVAAWDWARQNGYLSAAIDVTDEGDVPYGSTPAAESQPLLAREKSDWYVWEVTNWQSGAGQRTHDEADALDARFYESARIDITSQGQVGLASVPVTLTNPFGWRPTGKVCSALGTVWAVFRQGPNDKVAYWAGAEWRFPSGQPNTGGKVSSICSDGPVVYVAWPDSKVMQMRVTAAEASTTAMTTANVDRVTAMCVSSGMLCVAREGVHGEDGVPEGASAGYINYATPRAYVPCTPTLGESETFITMPDLGIVGMCTEGTWAYILTANGQLTHIYRFQPLTGTFEDAAGFADGFVGTCLCGTAGLVFIGGYYHPGVDANGLELAGVGIGAVYMLSPGSGVELLTDIGEEVITDHRVQSVAPHGKRLAVIAGESLLWWDLVKGGWHHRSEVGT